MQYFTCYCILNSVSEGNFMAKQQKKYLLDEYALNYVRELLVVTPPGGRLPGIRQMISDSRTGRVRLEKVLNDLELSGEITRRPQSGRYRSGNPPEAAPMVFIHFQRSAVVANDHSFPGGALKFLREKALENGLKLEIIHAAAMPEAELCGLLQRIKARQAFVWGADNVQIVNSIRQAVPYIVSILPHYPEAAISELRDSPDMTSIQLEYLFNCNYRNIAYIHNAEDWFKSPVQMQRLMDYYRIMAERGIKIEPEWVFYCAYNRDSFNRSMHKLLRSARPVEAVIVPGSSLKMLYDFCAANGIIIGSELAVMCSDDIAPELIPRATAVTNTPREVGIAAWEIMQKTMQNKIIRSTTRLRIITGETVPFIAAGNKK